MLRFGALAACVIAPLCPVMTACGADSPEPAPLRLLCYNIHHGEGTDGRLDLERIAGVIRSASPDVVALQEVDEKCTRTGGVDQPAELARLTGMKASFVPAIDFQGGKYGLCFLTRDDPGEVRRIALPGGEEPRVAGILRLRWNGTDLTIVNTHLDAGDRSAREPQVRHIASSLTGEAGTVILTGDFNSVRGDPVLTFLTGSGWEVPGKSGNPNTIPSSSPSREIDFVVFWPAGSLQVAEYRVLKEAVASDHRPVLAVLRRP